MVRVRFRRVMMALCGILLCMEYFRLSGSLATPSHATTVNRRQGRPRGKYAQDRGRESSFAAQFEKVWTTVRDHYYDKDFGGLDWNKIGEKYRVRLAEVETKAEFSGLVNQMLDELHASHTEYMTDDDVGFYMFPAVMAQDLRGHQVAHIGVMGKQVGSQYLVAGVLEGGAAEKANILSGDRLLTADGRPFTSAGSFRDKEGKSVRIELKREGEPSPCFVTVTPVKQNILRAYLDATEKSAKVIEINGKKIGYVHLWTMAAEAFRSTLERVTLEKLRTTDGLILDLRDGYGGSPFNFGNVFFQPEIVWEKQERGKKPTSQLLGYGKPMVVVINGGTRSAKEFLSYEFKVSHRAMLVGTRTAGAFLGANAFPIGKDGLLELAVLGLKVNGKRLEGTGIAPDIVVNPEFAYTSRDKQMARAQQILLEEIERIAHNGNGRANVVAH